jgi:hypothetical protein
MANIWKIPLYLLLILLLTIGAVLLLGLQRVARAHSDHLTAPMRVSAAQLVTTTTPTATATRTPAPTITATPTFVPTTPPDRALYLPVLLRLGPLPLYNGDFEQGNAGWQESSSGQFRLIFEQSALQEVVPHSGEWAAWLGGKSGEISELYQQVTIPIETPFLRYWMMIRTTADCGTDSASVLIRTSLLEQFPLCAIGNTDWTAQTIDLSAYAGQTVTLTFRVETDRDQRHSNLYLDDIGWVTGE